MSSSMLVVSVAVAWISVMIATNASNTALLILLSVLLLLLHYTTKAHGSHALALHNNNA
jgi:hypothetical protein